MKTPHPPIQWKLLLQALLLGSCLASAFPAPEPRAETHPEPALRRTSPLDGHWMSLSHPAVIRAFPEGSEAAADLRAGTLRPLGLASADLNSDGTADLIPSYSRGDRGFVTVHMGNPGTAYSNGRAAQQNRPGGPWLKSPFFAPPATFETEVEPQFLATGDFDRDGCSDLIYGGPDGDRLFFLRGDGEGGFSTAVAHQLPGLITTLASGDVFREDGEEDLMIGVDGLDGPRLLLYLSYRGGFSGEPLVLELPARANKVAVGQLDKWVGIEFAIATDHSLLLVHGRDGSDRLPESRIEPREVSEYAFAAQILDLQAGDYLDNWRDELAVLLADGTLRVMQWTEQELDEVRGVSVRSWAYDESKANLAGYSFSEKALRLASARLFPSPKEQILLLDYVNGLIQAVLPRSHSRSWDRDQANTDSSGALLATLESIASPVALRPMRVNLDTRSDLVLLSDSTEPLSFSVSSPLSSFDVNDPSSKIDADLNDLICDVDLSSDGAQCSFTAAVQNANLTSGAAISFSVAQAKMSTVEVKKPVTINGGNAVTLELHSSYSSLTLRGGSSTVIGVTTDAAIRLVGGDGNIIQHNTVGSILVEDSSDNQILGNSCGAIKITSLTDVQQLGGIVIQNNTVSGSHIVGIEDRKGSQGIKIINNRVFDNRTEIVAGGDGALIKDNQIGAEGSRNRAGGIHLYGKSNTVQDNTIQFEKNCGICIAGFSGTPGTISRALNNTITGNSIDSNDFGILLHNFPADKKEDLCPKDPENCPGHNNRIEDNTITDNRSAGVHNGGSSGLQVIDNTISGNRHGVFTQGDEAQIKENEITRNKGYGVALDGNLNLVRDNSIVENGTAPDPQGSTSSEKRGFGSGVEIWGGRGNRITQNQIYGNVGAPATELYFSQGLGIDVWGDGVTLNDEGEWNGSQNYPEMTLQGHSALVSLHSTPNSVFILDFYSNGACDPTGYGEGASYQSSLEVSTDTDGNWQGTYGAGSLWTATATLKNPPPEGSPNPGNTSEFSKCAAGPPPVVINSVEDRQLKSGALTCDTGSTVDRMGKTEAECTLRAAIELGNLREGTVQVEFDIPGTGPYLIEVGKQLRSALPTSLYPLSIDATTQPGYEGSPIIELSGRLAGEDADGLVLSGGNSTVKGLVINGFHRNGVVFESWLLEDQGEMAGNYVGTDLTGLLPKANGGAGVLVKDVAKIQILNNLISANTQGGVGVVGEDAQEIAIQGNLIGTDRNGDCPSDSCTMGNGGARHPEFALDNTGGIWITHASDVAIGGTSLDQMNTVSGNKGVGILILSSSRIRVEGNRIGTDRSGLKALPNHSHGISVLSSLFVKSEEIRIGGADHDPWTCDRSCNLVSANGAHGIHLSDLAAGSQTKVLGNFIGTTVDGAGDLGNTKSGVWIDSADDVHVGGTEVGAGNLISANAEDGVLVGGDFSDSPNGDGNRVEGNRIGTDAEGMKGLGNGGYGINVTPGSEKNQLGSVGAGNLISANGKGGINLQSRASIVPAERHLNQVQANLIGTAADGSSNLGNSGHGIWVDCNDTTVGGKAAEAGNTIAFNSQMGVLLQVSTYRNIVRGNSIHSNLGDGIQLGGVCEENQILNNLVYSNRGDGVMLGRKSVDNLIQGNTIHSNRDHGVVVDEKADRNQILTNSIYGNGGLGIDLQGGNQGIYRPRVLSALLDGSSGMTSVEAYFVTDLTGPALFEFFATQDCEGKTNLGATTLPHGIDGEVVFETDVAVPTGDFVSVTVTDAEGNTSEFGCEPVKQDTDGDGTPNSEDPEPNSASKAKTEGGTVVEAPEGVDLRLSPSPTALDPPIGIQPIGDPGIGTINAIGAGSPAQLSSSPLDLEPGGSITLTVYQPAGKTATTYYNFGPTPGENEPHWYEFLFDGTTGAEFLADRILLHFVDGQRGDHDLLANGVIVFFGVPADLADLYFPFFQADQNSFVGFAVSNISTQPAELAFEGLSASGSPLPFSDNPSVMTLDGQNQLARLGHEIFGAEPGTVQLGWVVLDTDNPKLGSFFQFGGTNQLDGSVAFSRQSQRFFFTRVYEGTTAFRGQSATTLLTIANPNSEAVTVEMTLVTASDGTTVPEGGSSASPVTRQIAARGFLTGSVSEILDVQDISGGYIKTEVTDGEGAVGFELIRLPQHQTVIGLNASSDSQSGRLYSAQLASASNIYTSLKLVNTSQEDRSVIVSAIGEQGNSLTEDVVVDLAPGESREWDVEQLFTGGETGSAVFEPASQTLLIGSLRLSSEGPGVVGDVIFGDPANFTYAAALPLQSRTFREAVFSQVANLSTFFTGLALYNPGAGQASITISVFDPLGKKTGEHQFTLEGGKRISDLVVNLVPSTTGQVGGYIVIRSTVGLVAQQLFGDYKLNLMSAVPPTVVQP